MIFIVIYFCFFIVFSSQYSILIIVSFFLVFCSFFIVFSLPLRLKTAYFRRFFAQFVHKNERVLVFHGSSFYL